MLNDRLETIINQSINLTIYWTSLLNWISVYDSAILDVILNWKARRSMSFHVKLRYILKVVSAAAWVIVLPVTYAYTWENPPGFAQTIKSWFGSTANSPSLFILAVVIYLSPNMLSAVLFLFPFIRRVLERSNYRIVMLIMWWSQVCRFSFEHLFSLWLVRHYVEDILIETEMICLLLSYCGSFMSMPNVLRLAA